MSSGFVRYKYVTLWCAGSLAGSAWLGWLFFGAEDKRDLLPGITTDGHHQIEQRCDVCHDSEPDSGIFTSSGVSNRACMECHARDLEMANDSHPVIKFRNPENAIFLEHINAMACVTCHTEHVEDRTLDMAVTVPADYCAHCHEVTLENRESHRDLAFSTCATAGCHNFHDNRNLSEVFLQRNAGQKDHLDDAQVDQLDAVYRWITKGYETGIPASGPDAPAEVLASSGPHIAEWADTAHAAAGINCSDCHSTSGVGEGWVDQPGMESCATCHGLEFNDFQQGKHGMRLAVDLSPMRPEMARLPMKEEVMHRSLDCTSCHGAHRFDRQFAAAEACMQCHDDQHTRSFGASSHFSLWQQELAGKIPAGSGVSCATCHLPREERTDPSTGERTMVVQHNQNANLSPNEKMYRSVCMDCHGLGFTMDALADPDAILNNFSSTPGVHVPSIDWVLKEEARRERVREARESPEPSSP